MCCLLQDGPGEATVAALGQESETPERVWNQNMATTAALEVANLANTARATQVPSQVLRCCKDLRTSTWALAS